MTSFSLLARIAGAVLLAGLAAAPVRGGEATVVKLRTQSGVQHETVVVGDVAHVSGPSPTLVRRLCALDLTVLGEVGESESITARHVQARLLLEGVDPRTVAMTGAPEVLVTRIPGEPVSAVEPVTFENDVLAQALEAMSRAWLAPPEDIDVQIVSSQSGLLASGDARSAPELDLPTRLEPGRIQARLRWMNQGKLERIEQVTLEARLRQTVVLATHNIERGVPLKPQDVVEDRRLLATRVEQIRAEQVVGAVAKRGLNQGDQLLARDLAVPRRTPAIQARRGVRVVARKGNLSVTLQMAEALEPGDVGDVIRLRNLESGRIITGRVVSSQEVEIPLN